MDKKNPPPRRLELNRTTIQNLDGARLAQARGAGVSESYCRICSGFLCTDALK